MSGKKTPVPPSPVTLEEAEELLKHHEDTWYGPWSDHIRAEMIENYRKAMQGMRDEGKKVGRGT